MSSIGIKKHSKIKQLSGYDITATVLVILFAVFCVYPMLVVLGTSFSDEAAIKSLGYSAIPRDFSLRAYGLVFRKGSSIIRAYGVSGTVTVIGTFFAVLITGMGGFTLANKSVRYRGHLSMFFYVTMLFNGGLVPWYMICTTLGLKDNWAALIVPNLLFSVWNMFLVRNFMRTIPDSIIESARIDGANDVIIAFRMYFPLSMPVLATITLFAALGYWNDWWNAVMLIDTNRDLYPLQYMLFTLQSDMAALRRLQQMGIEIVLDPPAETLKMATVIVTIGPIVLLYPFLQRYFVKGLVMGSVKG
ncbi:MAG: carbohydrate ABC transporter permease [Oscillospiraceae bacterium]|nr:carbohydrate ABC transporter permease [Oscillospiraceae bacterium]